MSAPLAIRLATASDLPTLMCLYAQAREQMRRQGNAVQWIDGYPQIEVISDDIANAHCWVLTDAQGICGAFALISGADPTYAHIEGGAWLNEEPYCTIHRIASNGRVPGIMAQAVAFSMERCNNLRIDTHEQNATMRHILKQLGFVYCGIIYTRGHSPRLAYQKRRDI